MKSIYLLLLITYHGYSSAISSRFITNPSPIQELYFDFKFSHANSMTQSIIVDGVKSISQCSLACMLNSEFRCDLFLYFYRNQSCFVSSAISTRNITLLNLFRRVQDCPDNFVYLRNYNKCYSWVPGSWNWLESRFQCNEIDSHPIVIDDSLELDALKNFIEQTKFHIKGKHPKCLDVYKLTWTAGIMIEPNKEPFVWRPFDIKNGKDQYLPIIYYKWIQGQPDNYLGVEYCLHLRMSLEYNDVVCNKTMCTVCEIDV